MSTRVNSVANNSPELLEPLAEDDQDLPASLVTTVDTDPAEDDAEQTSLF